MPVQAPTGVETRFRGAQTWTPRPEEAFKLRDTCPHITEARLESMGGGDFILDLHGDRLDQVTRAGALLPQDKRADIVVHRDAAGLQLAAFCRDETCQILLGVNGSEGRTVACTGAGYSVWMKKGTLYTENPD
jgi:hypothetical protein